MNYISVAEAAQRWGVSARSVRNYCALGRVEGAFLTGKTWNIPEDAQKPDRAGRREEVPKTLLEALRAEKSSGTHGGIYHALQIEMTYNSNHMEGSRLTHDQTRYIFETNTVDPEGSPVRADDVVETANHFKCIDMTIDSASHMLSEAFIKRLHAVLKNGTSDARRDWFAVGDYKRLPNQVGGRDTTPPEAVRREIVALLAEYNRVREKTLDELLDFHCRFESIHPFQDGNGRIGRLILFKECLRNDIVPCIIDEELKLYYYRGLQAWPTERGYLRETCLAAQDKCKRYLEYFRIPFRETPARRP